MRNSTIIRSLLMGLSAIAAAGGSSAVVAQEGNPSGPYVGGAYGQFNVKIDDLDELDDAIGDIDTDDGAWKVFFGWRFNPFFSLEADYIDLGNPRANFDVSGSNGNYTSELAGVAAYAIGTLPIGIFEISGKLGYYFHDVTINVDLDNVGSGNGDVYDRDDSGEAFVYGVGAGVTLIEHLNVKVEYEMMDIDLVDDAYTLWLSGAWRF
jgi:hypothetical protein